MPGSLLINVVNIQHTIPNIQKVITFCYLGNVLGKKGWSKETIKNIIEGLEI